MYITKAAMKQNTNNEGGPKCVNLADSETPSGGDDIIETPGSVA